MDRKQIINELKTVANVYAIGQHYVQDTSNYIVLKKRMQNRSDNCRVGGWQNYEVMCYAPNTSIIAMDTFVDSVLEKLKTMDVELTKEITEDFNDTEINMYMRSIQFRIPKEV